MRALLTDLVHILLSLPVYMVSLLIILAVVAFRRRASWGLHRWRYFLVVGALVSYCASAPICANALLASLEGRFQAVDPGSEPVTRTETILVLAAGYPRLTASGYRAFLTADGFQRVVAAVRLWQHSRGMLVFSGAPTPDFTDSMADEMARTAAAFGVPSDSILVEQRSANTYENLLYSRKLLAEKGKLGTPIVLVVSAFQMSRAVAVARKLELQVLPFPTDFRASPVSKWQDWIPSNDAAEDFESVMHELFGLLAYHLRGWA